MEQKEMEKKGKEMLDKVLEGRQYRYTSQFRVLRDAEDAKNEGEEAKPTEDPKEGEKKESKKMIVEGYASTFNQPYTLYDDGEFRIDEQVDANAFAETDMTDVIMQYDHQGRVFARTRNKTLEVNPDQTGLFIRADLSGTEAGHQLYDEIAGGYTDRMSFGFTILEDKREVIRDRETNKTTVLRTITKVGKLYDVSAVSIPANDGTSISSRSFCDGLIAELKAERLADEKELETRKRKAQLLLGL